MSCSPGGDVKASVRWSLFGTIACGAFQFGTMMVLARLVTPAEYGVYALCVAIVALSPAFVANVMERTLIVTPPGRSARDETTAIILLCLAAGGVALATCIIVNSFAAAPIDLGVLALLVTSACIGAAAVTPRVLLRRQMRFGPIVTAEIAALLVGQGVFAIGLAAAGWGAYALSAAACVQSSVTVLVLRLHVRDLPFGLPDIREAAALVRRAAGLGMNILADIANGQIPPLVLGARLGAAPLGLFNRSYSLVQLPIQMLVLSMNRVLLSALVAVNQDKPRLRSASRSLAALAAVVATPLAAGMAGASHNLLLLAFGRQWLAAESIIPLIALSAWATMMGYAFSLVSEAMRAFRARFHVQLASGAAILLMTLTGCLWELEGAVAGLAIASCFFLFLFARLTADLLELPLFDVLAWLMPGIVIALPCFAASAALGASWDGPAVAVLAVQIASCGIIHCAMLVTVYPALALRLLEAGFPPVLRYLPFLARHLRQAAARHA